jgi:hypothetical protein
MALLAVLPRPGFVMITVKVSIRLDILLVITVIIGVPVFSVVRVPMGASVMMPVIVTIGPMVTPRGWPAVSPHFLASILANVAGLLNPIIRDSRENVKRR